MPAPTMQSGIFSTTTFNALGTYVDDVRTGILARGRRTTSSSTTTGTVGVLRIDDVPIIGGHVHRIWSSALAVAVSTSGASSRVDVRYTTDGSTPTTASSVMPGAATSLNINNSVVVETALIQTTYTPAADEILSLLLCVTLLTGGGNTSIFGDTSFSIDLVLEDYGIDPGDVGVDI